MVNARNPPLLRPGSRAELAEHAFARATGASASAENSVALLLDARENFPAWLAAIAAAQHSIRIETYILDDDAVGARFVDVLRERARAGVQVFAVFDWMGSMGAGRLFTQLREAGVHVGIFNPPSIASPLGWITRNHRKTITIDGSLGFVSGLCISEKWEGDPARHRAPWRDTGIVMRGPAVADIARAFDDIWQTCAWGAAPTPPVKLPPPAGNVQARVVAGVPDHTGTYRLDLVIASIARRYLWLTDAYFVGTSAYVHALAAAAQDGVDVRLLVPGSSDIAALRPLSRAAYRGLIDAGVRVFEWDGTMLHAKSAVADDRWSRIGSTNLNLASWMGNYELDVAIEDVGFAQRMAAQYEKDLENSTEIVITSRNRLREIDDGVAAPKERHAYSGSAGRAAAGAASVGAVLGAALTNRRELSTGEGGMLGIMGAISIVVAVIAFMWPAAIGWPLAVIGLWLGSVWLLKALALWRMRRKAAPIAEAQGESSDV